MSEEKEKEKDKGLHIGSGGAKAAKPPTPRTIAAQSQAWTNKARTVILGGSLLSLFILIGIAMFVRPEYVKDLLWAAVAVAAFVAGSAEISRKDEK
jgi:hypothetical protein